jgi:HK97 family phage prohead protease
MMLRAFNIEDFEVRALQDDLTREFIISTERKDSHGTVIRMDGWQLEDFNKAGAFYYQHQTTGGFLTDSNPDNALGPATARAEGNILIGVGKFETEDINPLADKIRKKVDYGTMRATSVGFMPIAGRWGDEKRDEDPTTYYFTSQRLAEWSIVHVPSNPDAIKKSMESMDNFMNQVKDIHKSEGFRKDYSRKLNEIRRKREYLLGLMDKRNY